MAISSTQWSRDAQYDLPVCEVILSYSVTNLGTKRADSIAVTLTMDGTTVKEMYANNGITGTYSTSVPYDTNHQFRLSASCPESQDSSVLVFTSTLPRWSTSCSIWQLYVTPNDPIIKQKADQICTNDFIPDIIEIKDWVANHITYRYDSEVHGQEEYYQLPRETLRLGAGDCEDFSILFVSLIRAKGYSANRAFCVVGYNPSGGHAWAWVELDILGWWTFEPQSTTISNFWWQGQHKTVTINGETFTAAEIFNDKYCYSV
jgi:predicted transglutaminase-like cysteine proteinase